MATRMKIPDPLVEESLQTMARVIAGSCPVPKSAVSWVQLSSSDRRESLSIWSIYWHILVLFRGERMTVGGGEVFSRTGRAQF